MFLDIYKTLVRPVWTSLYKNDAKVSGNIQGRAIRLVKSLSGLSYQERLKELGLPSLEYRRLRANVIEVFKIKNNK